VKYTVPPEILVPVGLVGWVRPGPLFGPVTELLELLLLLDEPQAAAMSATRTAPTASDELRLMLRMLTFLQV
jgi:hypothetical protein